MANLVFTPAGGGTVVTFLPAPVGWHRTAGKYWTKRPFAPPGDFDPNKIVSSGTDGAARSFDGFRGRVLGPYETVYVGIDKAALATAYLADRAALEGVKDFTVAVPDDPTSYPGCTLDAAAMQGPGMVGAPYETEALFCLEVTWLFENDRLAS